MRWKVSQSAGHLDDLWRRSSGLLSILILALGVGVACDKRFPAQRQGNALCDTLAGYISTADASIAEELWTLAISDEQETLDSLASKRRRWREFLREAKYPERVDRLLKEVREPETLRRLWLARWRLLNAEIENDTSLANSTDRLSALYPVLSRETVSQFRINDSSNSRAHRSRAFRDRFLLDPQITGWTPRIVRLLNQKCQSVGYSSYLEVELAEDSLSSGYAQSAIEALDSISAPYYRRTIDSISLFYDAVRPDASDIYFFAEHGPENVQRILTRITRRKVLAAFVDVANKLGIDLHSVGLYLDTSDATPSYSVPRVVVVNAPEDIRVALGSLNKPADLMYLTSFSLEMGKVLSALLSESSDVFYHRFPGGLWESAVGMILDDMMFSQRALRIAADVRDNEWVFFSRWLEMRRIIGLRYTLLNAAFETEFYGNPNRDPLKLYQELFRKYLFVSPPDNYDQWSLLFWSHGVRTFRVIRLLGEAVAAQITSRGFSRTGDIGTSNEFATFFRERCLRSGARVSWRRLLESATGEVLNLQYMMARYRPFGAEVITK